MVLLWKLFGIFPEIPPALKNIYKYFYLWRLKHNVTGSPLLFSIKTNIKKSKS